MQDHDPGTLSESENLLLRAVLSGTIADLGGQTVRAEVVRSILAAKPDEQNTYAFVRIRRAVIEGGLDLEGHEIDRSILMNAVRFTGDRQRGAVILRDARIRRLSLQNCDLNGPLVADRVYLENGLFLGGGNVQGALQLRGAIVAGAVAVEGTKLGDGTSSILANGAQLTGPLMLRRARCAGQVSLSRARLKAGLLGEQIKIRSEPEMDCIVCDGANVDGDLSLEEGGMTGRFSLANVNVTGQLRLRGLEVRGGGLSAEGLRVRQGVDLDAAKIFGTLDLNGVDIGKQVTGEGLLLDGGDVALTARVARFGGDVSLPQLRAVGEIRMPGASIAGQLRMTEARIFGSELAVRADGLNVAGGWFLSRSAIVGLVRCPAAEFGNQLRMSGATIKVDHGVALMATGATFSRDIELNDSFNTIGAVMLDQSRITGTLDLSRSHIKSVAIARGQTDRGQTDRGQTGRNLNDRGKTDWGGTDRLGARDGRIASVVGELDDLPDPFDAIVLSAIDSEIGCLIFPERGEQRPRGIVDLSRAHVASLIDFAAAWPPLRGRGATLGGRDIDHFRLDGLTYDHLANPTGTAIAPTAVGRLAATGDGPQNGYGSSQSLGKSPGVGSGQSLRTGHAFEPNRNAGKRRIDWLMGQSADATGAHFKPQPWVQLARQLRAQGHDDAARDVTIMQRRLSRSAVTATPADRWQSRLLDWFALYGFNPWRTVAWMLAFVFLFTGIWAWAATLCADVGCTDETILIATAQDRYSQTGLARGYPDFNALAYSVDAFFPFVNLGYDDHWRFNFRFGPLFSVPVPSVPALLSVVTGGEPASLVSNVTVTIGSLLYCLVLLERLLGLVLSSLAVTAFTGLLQPRR